MGSPSLIEEMKINIEDKRIIELQKQGKTVVFALVDGNLAGAFALSDRIREVSKEAIRKLKENGIKVYMLTGDAEEVAASVSEELGIDDYFAQVLPDQKAEKIKLLKEKGLKVAMLVTALMMRLHWLLLMLESLLEREQMLPSKARILSLLKMIQETW